MHSKRLLAILTAAVLLFSLAACEKEDPLYDDPTETRGDFVLEVYAPEEMMPIMSDLIYRYASVAPRATVRVQYDEGAILTAKIEAGAACDVFISDESRFMDWLDEECGEELNPNRNDKIVSATRAAFAVGPGNSKYAEEELAEDEVYMTTYSAAVCRATGKSYESEQFVKFMLSDDVKDIYETYGFHNIED